MRHSSIFLCLIILMSWGCADHSAHLETLDKLEAQLAEADSVFIAWPTEAMEAQRVGVNERLDLVTDLYDNLGDTMDMDLGDYLSKFKGTGKIFKRFGPTYHRLTDGLATGKKQLEDLRHDLEQGVLGADDAQRFVSDEQRAIGDLHLEITRLDTLIKRSMERYDAMVSKVDSVILDLESRAER